MRTRSVVPSLALSLALVLHFADSAQAGPVEQLAQVALHPTDSKVIVLRYKDGGDGFFYSRDAGKSWQLTCLSAIDNDVPRSGPIAVTGDGHVMMGVFQGLFIDDAKGCGWERNSLIGDVWVSDVVPDPTDSGVMFAATSKGGMGVLNGIVKRDADGEFSEFGKKEELLITRLRVVEREGGLRFYESVLKGQIKVVINGMEVDAPNYLIRYSDDDAETFVEFPFGGTDGNLRLQAVDPSNPDRVIAVLDRQGKDDDVLVSEDRGEHFIKYMSMSEFGAIAFLPSGKVFLGEAGFSTMPTATKGLWVADSLAEEPTKIGDYAAQCLVYQESTDTLFACQYRTFGTVDQTSGEYTQLFRFNDVTDFVDCGAEDTAASCEAQLCKDYCGIGHFATAPVCDVYTRPGQLCGPCAAMVDNGADISACTMSGGSGSGGISAAGSGGTSPGSAGRTAGASAEPPKPTAGTGPAPNAGTSGGDDGDDDGDDDGGLCSCASVGASGGDTTGPIALSVMMGLALALRRRRVRP